MAKNIKTARFTLTGRTPLLMHASDVELEDMLASWRKDPANKNLSKPGDDRSPAWSWQTGVYRDADGFITMPTDNVMACLRKAGSQITLKRQTTFKSISQSGLLIAEESLDFRCHGKKISFTEIAGWRDEPFATHKANVKKLGFDLLVKRATIGTSKHVRVRAMFSQWAVGGTIQIISPEITMENLQQLFELAGSVGLGDWRPGGKTPGRFGMFEAEVKAA